MQLVIRDLSKTYPNGVDYVLLAALAMTVHVVVNQKYLGHVVQ
jgi:hypothetical protein